MRAAGKERGADSGRRTLYGRSRGKALRSGQERLIGESLPKLEIDPGALASPPTFEFEPKAFWLEIGFGAGEHLIEQAKANPDVGFIGCEPFLNGVAAALAGIEREGLSNVRLRRGDAQALVEAAPDAFFSRVFILYPDPWPKRRHNKRRIVSGPMVTALARVAQARRRGALRHRHRRLRRLDVAAFPRFALISLGGLGARSTGAAPGRTGGRRAMRSKRKWRAERLFT